MKLKDLFGIRTLFATALLALGIITTPAHAVLPVQPVQFTPTNPIGGAPVGWGFAGNKFVGSILDNNITPGVNLLYSTNLTGGNVQPFGFYQPSGLPVVLAPSYGFEHYVSSSIGLGGFNVGDVFVASGNNVERITNAGVADPLPFIQSGSFGTINGDIRGITFDSVGTFQNQMIVTTHTGYVYTVNSAGIFTEIGQTGEDTEGLDVQPMNGTWTNNLGWLFIASEGGAGTIRAIKPGSFAMVTIATGILGAEELNFVPMNLGVSGNPLEGLYGANYSLDVLHAPASDFAGMLGDIIITGETNGTVNRLQPNLNLSLVGNFPNQPEDGLFVTANILAADGVTTPEPASLSLLALGVSTLLLRRRK